MKRILLLCLLIMTGCAGSLAEAHREGVAQRRGVALEQVGLAPSDRCVEIDESRGRWGAVAAGAAVVSGASGVATLPAEELPDRYQGGARYGAAGTALLAAAVSAYALHREHAADEAWVRECAP